MGTSRRKQRRSRGSLSESEDESEAFRPHRRRKSSRGNHSVAQLAQEICLYRKRVLFITGAGISVASGVRPFRGDSGVWTSTIWTNATRDAFRKNPLKWYNDFWLPNLSLPQDAKPNQAHIALQNLLQRYPSTLNMITQNVDGLHTSSNQLIEAHGRLGLFKCMPDEDSDTDSEDDDDDERAVHLGHRRKRRLAMEKKVCPYQLEKSVHISDVEPLGIRKTLQVGGDEISKPPMCPSCENALAPQALLFDEGYHSHDFYQFRRMEEWLASAQVIVFVGTSFSVRLPEIALEHARAKKIPVFNFNTMDLLESTAWLNATNIKGPSERLIPKLLEEVKQLEINLGVVVPPSQDVAIAGEEATKPCAQGTIKVRS